MEPELLTKASRELADGDIESAMTTLAQYFDEDADRETHPVVVALLRSCAENARIISFEYYASLK